MKNLQNRIKQKQIRNLELWHDTSKTRNHVNIYLSAVLYDMVFARVRDVVANRVHRYDQY